MHRRLVSIFCAVFMLGAISDQSRAKTFVFPHMLETAGKTSLVVNSWDTFIYAFYGSGIGTIPDGGGATVDIYLYDDTGSLLQSATANDVCAPCSFTLGARNLKEEIEIDQLILDAGGGAYPPALTGGWAIIQTSGDTDALSLQAITANNTGGPAELELEEWQLPELTALGGGTAPTAWAVPHAIDFEGSFLVTPNTWDTFVYLTYAAGRAGVAPGAGVDVDVYLYDQDTEDLLEDDQGGPICAPCVFNMDSVTPKRELDLEQLIRDANGGNYTATPVHKISVLMLLSGDADGFATGAVTFNAWTGPADLMINSLTPIAVVPPTATAVADGFPLQASLETYPNPSPGLTTIRFRAPRAGAGSLEILDLRGRRVATLRTGHFSDAAENLSWDGRDENGVLVGSGVYLARFQRGPWLQQAKIVLTR